ncbi:MAG: SusC/RagA family TonB-linked outer membrane protein, partial [Gemmatimonadales bacterium]
LPLERSVRTGSADVRLVMQEAVINLHEVVVTGTPGGTQRRELGNAVAKLDFEELQTVAPASNGMDALIGRAAGVTLIKGSGAVGEGGRIRVRGTGSVALSNEPLVYIDGVRVDAGNKGTPGGNYYQGAHRLNDIPLDDIESVEIIKGPAAATLYGTEAAAGVIQIITKKGQQGRTRVSTSVRHGANWVPSPEERFRTHYRRNADGSLFSYNPVADETLRGSPFWRTGHLQDYGLDVNGGTDAIQYFLGGGWLREEGVQNPNQVQQARVRTNVRALLSSKLDVSLNLGYTAARTDYANTTLGAGQAYWPNITPTNFRADGRYFQNIPTPGEYAAVTAEYENLDKITGGVQVNHNPTTWFSHRLTLGFDQNVQEQKAVRERQTDERLLRVMGNGGLGYQNLSNYSSLTNTIDYAGTLTIPITRGLASKTSVGAQYYRQYVEANAISAQQFPAPGVTAISAASNRTTSGTFVESITVGTYVQQQFSVNDRLFLTGAIRADDNSAFGEDFDLITYPKVSAAWVVSEEPFWPLPMFNTFRLRAAYGKSGRQPVSFASLRTYQPVVALNDQAGVRPSSLGNPDLGPEVGSEIEIGFDASAFDDRLGIEFTYYDKRTKDMILNVPVAPSSGFRLARPENVGEVKNTGFEVQLRGVPVASRNVRWDLGLSVAKNDNVVTDMGGLPPLFFTTQEVREGFPVYGFFGKEVLSADVSVNGNAITAANIMCDGGRGRDGLELGGDPVPCAQAPNLYLGRLTPEFDGAMTTGLTLFNRLTLNALVDYQVNVVALDYSVFGPCAVVKQCAENVVPDSALANPLAFADDLANGSSLRARRLHPDRSYARLRSLSATLSLPDSWARLFGGESATFTLAGRNLWLLWDRGYEGIDPDITSRSGAGLGEASGGASHYGLNFLLTPLNRQVSATLRMTF